jgi:predicted acylesterase/phospholipase RssA
MSRVRTAFLARVPIFFLLVVVLLGALSFFSPVEPTFRGLFTLDEKGHFELSAVISLFLVSLSVFSIALAATSSINLIIEHGPSRMSPSVELPAEYLKYRPSILVYSLCQIPALFFVACCLRQWSTGWFIAIAAILGGWLVAHLFLILAIGIEILLSDPCTELPNMLVLPLPESFVGEGRIANKLRASDPAPSARRATDKFANLLARYALPLLPGYLYQVGAQYKLYPGVLFNTTFSIVGVLTWIAVVVGVVWAKQAYASLAFVLLAILILMLLSAGAAFFLDRYRIPLSLTVLLYVFLVGGSSATDHLYRVEKTVTGNPVPEFAQPSEVLKPGSRPIVIMTAGGGIQAAAWTTQVLASVEELAKKEGVEFAPRIVLISSVSGGSLGAYHAAVAYHEHGTFEQARLRALESALDEVAWGWMGPDLVRTFLPYAWRPEIDRGWALENKWDRIAGFPKESDFYMDELAQDTRSGSAPAFIMNATAIEDGSPFIITSTAFHPTTDNPATLRHVKEFNSENHNQFRIRVSTAARLSASFPYVAPAARSNGHSLAPDYHVVDGGYYDNFGIRSALDWLIEACPEGKPKPQRIALVEIRWGDPSDIGGSIQGWRYQASAPLSGVLNVRGKEQLREDEVALRAFRRDWKDAASELPFEFAYTGEGACSKQPESWKLTSDQQKCIQTTWSMSPKIQAEAARLVKFLK